MKVGILGAPIPGGSAASARMAEALGYLRVIPGSWDMDPGIGGPSLQALAKQVLPELRG